MRYFVYFGITFTGLYYFASMIALSILCTPRDGKSQASYLLTTALPQCVHGRDIINLLLGVVNVLTDFYLLILPLPAVWSLHLPARKKIGVSAIFLTGFA